MLYFWSGTTGNLFRTFQKLSVESSTVKNPNNLQWLQIEFFIDIKNINIAGNVVADLLSRPTEAHATISQILNNRNELVKTQQDDI